MLSIAALIFKPGIKKSAASFAISKTKTKKNKSSNRGKKIALSAFLVFTFFFLGGEGESLEKNTEEPKENPELERLKTSGSYKQDFDKIFLELRQQNPMLKPGNFTDKLVHAEMLDRVAEHA